MCLRPAQAVGGVDGGGGQGLRQAHPQVDAGQVHHHRHGQAVRVRVEVRAERNNHPVTKNLAKTE